MIQNQMSFFSRTLDHYLLSHELNIYTMKCLLFIIFYFIGYFNLSFIFMFRNFIVPFVFLILFQIVIIILIIYFMIILINCLMVILINCFFKLLIICFMIILVNYLLFLLYHFIIPFLFF